MPSSYILNNQYVINNILIQIRVLILLNSIFWLFLFLNKYIRTTHTKTAFLLSSFHKKPNNKRINYQKYIKTKRHKQHGQHLLIKQISIHLQSLIKLTFNQVLVNHLHNLRKLRVQKTNHH
jgi:hypothetical protein